MTHALEHFVITVGEFGYAWPDRTTLLSLLDGPSPPRRQWHQLLHRAYGRDALSTGAALFGRDLKLNALPYLQANAHAIVQRIKESPGLAALLQPFVKVGTPVPADFSVIREPALQRGLTPQAWRWLSHQSAATVRKLFAFGWTEEAIFWANLFAEAQAPTRHARLSSDWLEAGRPYGMHRFVPLMAGWRDAARQQGREQLVRYCRLLPCRPRPEDVMQHEGIGVELFLALQSQGFDLLKQGQTWRGLWRKVEANRALRVVEAQTLAAERSKGKFRVWTPLLGGIVLRKIDVKELASEHLLIQEGVEMRHCVGGGHYAEECSRGECVVFSLTHSVSGAKATLQLVRNPNKPEWRIGQLAGAGNARPSAIFWEVAKDLRTHVHGAPPAQSGSL